MASLSVALGRVLLGAYFLITGGMIVLAPEAAGELFVGAGMAPQAATVAGVFECLAGLSLALGMATRIAAGVLAIWTVLAFLMFDPWTVPGTRLHEVLMHMAVVGGLVGIAGQVPPRWSLDSARHRARADRAAARRRAEAAGETPSREGRAEMSHPVCAE